MDFPSLGNLVVVEFTGALNDSGAVMENYELGVRLDFTMQLGGGPSN